MAPVESLVRTPQNPSVIQHIPGSPDAPLFYHGEADYYGVSKLLVFLCSDPVDLLASKVFAKVCSDYETSLGVHREIWGSAWRTRLGRFLVFVWTSQC